ncbi:DISARM system phospholipase D-like protein DrmC [Methylocaldum sp. GT1BB]|jgi:cardiolipin synthase|uniref:DISARM system phospholipase D-like protein DrmC n=1 Tax=Methylocaldum sp. GT1BB TaxID=3438963 RepID=UPI003DA0FA76
MTENFAATIENLIRKAPDSWLQVASVALHTVPPAASAEFVLRRIPATNNADISFLMGELVKLAVGKMSWEALGWALSTACAMHHRWQSTQQIELLWGGPLPADRIPARRIDQVLYDLIADAKREILLMTFAAAKVERLGNELLKAMQRDVHIRLILEFEQSSEGQLSYDALNAFPLDLVTAAEVYRWPIEKRERNRAGRPGKLHAKLAIVDETVLISSANLTDDAFNRNLEAGVRIRSPEFLVTTKEYVDSLIADRTLDRMKP